MFYAEHFYEERRYFKGRYSPSMAWQQEQSRTRIYNENDMSARVSNLPT